MKRIIGRRILVSVGSIFLVLLALGCITYSSTRQLNETSREVLDRQVVVTQLTELMSMLKDAETGQRGYVITGASRYLQPYSDARQKLDTTILSLNGRLHSPEEQLKMKELSEQIVIKLEELQAIIDIRTESGFDAARKAVLTDKGKKSMDEIRRLVGALEAIENERLSAAQQEAMTGTRNLYLALVVGCLVAAVLVVATGVFMMRGIFRVLDRLGAEMRESSSVLNSSAGEIVAITSQLASGSAQTANAVNETTVTVEEVKQAAVVSAQKARAVSDTAQKSAQFSQSGLQSVEGCKQGMERVQEQMESIAESILRLSEQSQAIGEIITSVNDLTEQSNLLAVNAAIEAAKAGEFGRGFSVVAQEIKSLAEQSRQATAQVRAILGDTQKATGAAVMAAEQGSRAVADGVRQTREAETSIRQLTDSIGEAAHAATQIAASSQQQTVGMDQVAQAMDSIKLASQQNVGSTRQAETAAHNLSESGRRLMTLLEQYRL
ncbi:methyl-accepting chemotaxis protein [Paludibacterium paludis]|uniref:Methyl-accepting transducer domain-containing protein n=1 Tax=Paludibacterium paludis TaxID=1225769 RepID=A0A918P5B5_9NEIS|nr:methyl-accepting chemotaxis protein [Paludibacterium paludis]GGY22267.1 hypothetical protein GCM10011289_27430 [Paludibacterium paludis]